MSYREEVKFPEYALFMATGGAGVIGSNLREAILELGYRGRCLDDLSTGHYHNVEPFEANLRLELIKGASRTWIRVSERVRALITC